MNNENKWRHDYSCERKKKLGFLMPPHLLTDFQIQKYYQDEPKFNGVSSRDNLQKIKGGVYVINLDEYKSKGTHSIVLYVNGDNGIPSYNATLFDTFEHIPNETEKLVGNKSIVTNTYRIQAYESIMCGYVCIGFILLYFVRLFFSQRI